MHNEATSIIASSSNTKSKKVAWIHTDLRQLKTWRQYFGSRRRQKYFYSKFNKIICVSKLAEESAKQLLALSNTMVIMNPVDRETDIKVGKRTYSAAEKDATVHLRSRTVVLRKEF